MKEIREKLTPSADFELHRFLEECERMILDEAFSIASRNHTGDQEISLSDIMEAKKILFHKTDYSQTEHTIAYFTQSDQRIVINHEKRKLVLFLAIFAGLIYMFIGVLMYLMDNRYLDLNKDSGILFALLGAFLTVFTIFYSRFADYRARLKRLKKKEIQSLDNQIIKLWSRIEDLGYSIMDLDPSIIDKDFDTKPNVDYISSILGPDEYKHLKTILTIRNQIVHGESVELTKDEKEETISKEYFIIDELERILSKRVKK